MHMDFQLSQNHLLKDYSFSTEEHCHPCHTDQVRVAPVQDSVVQAFVCLFARGERKAASGWQSLLWARPSGSPHFIPPHALLGRQPLTVATGQGGLLGERPAEQATSRAQLCPRSHALPPRAHDHVPAPRASVAKIAAGDRRSRADFWPVLQPERAAHARSPPRGQPGSSLPRSPASPLHAFSVSWEPRSPAKPASLPISGRNVLGTGPRRETRLRDIIVHSRELRKK